MKRILSVLLACLLLAACGEEIKETESVSTEPTALTIPEDLPGVWVSADAGELDMIETITFYENGDLSVSSVYRGSDMGTIYGTYGVFGHTIYCEITQGTNPYEVQYEYLLDGRELTLMDDDGPAHYLRTS